jgi:hypothetical protein
MLVEVSSTSTAKVLLAKLAPKVRPTCPDLSASDARNTLGTHSRYTGDVQKAVAGCCLALRA